VRFHRLNALASFPTDVKGVFALFAVHFLGSHTLGITRACRLPP
jgi:hypothetical protein